MKKLTCTLFGIFVVVCMHAQVQTQLVSGVVTSPENEPLANAVVTVKGTFVETETSPNGVFQIEALPDDELVVTAFLMYPKTVSLSGVTSINIEMEYNAEVLEAVSLQEKQKKKKYLEKEFTKRDADKVGYSYEDWGTRFISGADVSMYTVARKIPFLDVVGNENGFQVFNSRMRGAISTSRVPVQVMIDGAPVEQNALFILDPNQITNITMYRSLAGTIKYGSLGYGGVMSITTTNSGTTPKNSRKLPSLLIQGNNYNEGILPISDNITMNTAPFIDELKRASTLEGAFVVYNNQRKLAETRNLAYYLAAANFFSRWGETHGYTVLSDLFEQANNNPRILKAIAFSLEEDGHLVQASYVLEKLLQLKPDNIQAYRDVARIYARTNRFNLAATLYKQMIYNTVPNVNFEPIHPIIFNEFRHLIANHKRKINFKNIPNEFMSVNFKKDVRIVIEYTNPLAEFEVQFVSPSKKYYSWRHTYFDSKDLIEEELEKGFALKEFLIEDSDYGNWIVNVKSTAPSEGATPTLLKYTLYQNYGQPNETKEVKLVNLSTQSTKGTVDTFMY